MLNDTAMPDATATSNAPPDVSVLTIVRGRERHLQRQAIGLARSRHADAGLTAEWIIVSMGEAPPEWAGDMAPNLPLRTTRVEGARDLPLAEARAKAGEMATGRVLVFLDVDCIPTAECLRHLVAAAEDGGLWMGDVRYLPAGEPQGEDWTEADLERVAVAHPLLPQLAAGERVDRPHEMFWSLCFAARADQWETIGGFDAGYEGYGAEDTDVAFAARAAGVDFGNVGARAYHQHHAVCQPPLNHTADLVANARRFHGKWGVWPMDKWLRQLDEAGYVRFDEDADVCEVVRLPTADEIAAATVDTPAGFSTNDATR